MMLNFLWEIFEATILRTIWQILRAPIWWYGRGIVNTIKWIGGGIGTRYKILGIKVLARNFFRPMYGVQDFAGRIISLVARSLILVWRLGIMVVWAAGGLFLLIAWIGGPLLAIYQLVWGYKV